MKVFFSDHSLLSVCAYVNTISVSNGIKYYAILKTMQLMCAAWVTVTGSQARDRVLPSADYHEHLHTHSNSMYYNDDPACNRKV